MARRQKQPQSELDAPTATVEHVHMTLGPNRQARRAMTRRSKGRIRLPVTNEPYRAPTG